MWKEGHHNAYNMPHLNDFYKSMLLGDIQCSTSAEAIIQPTYLSTTTCSLATCEAPKMSSTNGERKKSH